jgi:lysophospholipase L1-like esterase
VKPFLSSCAALVLVATYASITGAQTVSAPTGGSSFALHDGDSVTFYGDSITEQREYTEYVEEYVLTRFPQWKVTFHNAGVGGDRVSGGSAGPIDLRLERDLLAVRPNVVTIMLGMNDGYHRPSQPGIVSSYVDGYRHIVDTIQKNLPQCRITLIQPSPFDDITREAEFPGGYNGALLVFGDAIGQLAKERNYELTDFNAPVTAMLKTLNQNAPNLAQQLLPDRVHPAEAGHWIMAEALLKHWNAPSTVSSVTLAAVSKSGAEAQNSVVTDLRRAKGTLSWTQLDGALPLPLPPAEVDPVLALTLKFSDITASLNQQTLQIHGLPTGNYDLLIDQRKSAMFSSDELSGGVNLATLDTPMLEQSRLVAVDTEKKNNLEGARFKIISASSTAEASKTAAALAQAINIATARQRADSQPRPHQFQIVPHQ